MNLAAIEAAVEHGDGAAALDRALIEQHRTRDPTIMCALHKLAVRFWRDDPAQAAFHRTHAYVYALEGGMWDEVEALYATLSSEGRI